MSVETTSQCGVTESTQAETGNTETGADVARHTDSMCNSPASNGRAATLILGSKMQGNKNIGQKQCGDRASGKVSPMQTHANQLQDSLDQQFNNFDENANDNEEDIFEDAEEDTQYIMDEFSTLIDDKENEDHDTEASASESAMNPTHLPPIPTSTASSKARIPRAMLPTWLGDEYADACAHLEQEIAKTGRPACYKQGLFTMTAPPFMFLQTVLYDIHLIDFYQPEFFGHDDCMPALAEILVTLAKYGHAPVKVVFTDNAQGDKAALEQAFP
ncbi:hypothetical protein PAXINDRAFT_15718 [Paxillus involutus ATCC 200175]|uniref:Uncharacterized protein n=1 Tax=Paxillus involutus ATCC 200175 TaxID=664439 RepID=A0A0C9TVR9_PAXIN|nr:hypothetical protein PAXINDRAFT_15718 [Paxillus involutus ATCC 200175]